MENEIDINRSLSTQDLFGLFSVQLAKDFEGAGLPGVLPETIPSDFVQLRELLAGILKRNSASLSGLLYRVDISEAQLRKANEKADQEFEIMVAELIVKRVLQKVIIKKNFSAK